MSFQCAWWLQNPHLQTAWPFLFRQRCNFPTREERFELIDGDFIDAVWAGNSSGPIVIILSGVEGHINSTYVNAMLAKVCAAGWRGLFLHYRNCSASTNRLERYYHIGDTGDLMNIISIIRHREPKTILAAVGFSLGGNVLLKWLGEMSNRSPFRAAATISAPFMLAQTNNMLEKGAGRMYERYIIQMMRKAILKKFKHHPSPPVDLAKLHKLTTFIDFDTHITAPLHGFDNVQSYYEHASCCFYLKKITTPCLVINALDDPLVPPSVIPELSAFSSSTRVEQYQHGGHLGFVAGKYPGIAEYWVEQHVTQFFRPLLCTKK